MWTVCYIFKFQLLINCTYRVLAQIPAPNWPYSFIHAWSWVIDWRIRRIWIWRLLEWQVLFTFFIFGNRNMWGAFYSLIFLNLNDQIFQIYQTLLNPLSVVQEVASLTVWWVLCPCFQTETSCCVQIRRSRIRSFLRICMKAWRFGLVCQRAPFHACSFNLR